MVACALHSCMYMYALPLQEAETLRHSLHHELEMKAQIQQQMEEVSYTHTHTSCHTPSHTPHLSTLLTGNLFLPTAMSTDG